MSALAIPRVALAEDLGHWHAHWVLDKREGDWAHLLRRGLDHLVPEKPYESLEFEGNLLMLGGVSSMLEQAIGNGTATAGQALTYFSNAQAAVGVGDSSTAEAATQTDLQAATNKLRVGMDATYPLHTDGTATAGTNNKATWRSTFATGQANFVWAEWIIANSATAATGRALNRKVQALGTKASGTWTLTVDVTIS